MYRKPTKWKDLYRIYLLDILSFSSSSLLSSFSFFLILSCLVSIPLLQSRSCLLYFPFLLLDFSLSIKASFLSLFFLSSSSFTCAPASCLFWDLLALFISEPGKDNIVPCKYVEMHGISRKVQPWKTDPFWGSIASAYHQMLALLGKFHFLRVLRVTIVVGYQWQHFKYRDHWVWDLDCKSMYI